MQDSSNFKISDLYTPGASLTARSMSITATVGQNSGDRLREVNL
jgi:hypothetical protein